MSIPDTPLHSGRAMRLIKHPVTALSVFVVVLWHGVFTDVMSADVFFTLPVAIFIGVVALVFSLFAWRRMHRNDPYFGNVITRPLIYLLTPFVLAGVVWMFLAKSVPWTAAVVFGVPHAESHEFTLSTYRQKGCNSVAKPVKRLNMFPGKLCVNEDYVRRHGHRVVLLRLEGGTPDARHDHPYPVQGMAKWRRAKWGLAGGWRAARSGRYWSWWSAVVPP